MAFPYDINLAQFFNTKKPIVISFFSKRKLVFHTKFINVTRLLPKLACTGSYHFSGWPLSIRILTRHNPYGNVAQVNARIRMQSRSHRVVLYNTRISGCVHSMVSSSKSVHGKNLRREDLTVVGQRVG